jgi:hypothetical protein
VNDQHPAVIAYRTARSDVLDKLAKREAAIAEAEAYKARPGFRNDVPEWWVLAMALVSTENAVQAAIKHKNLLACEVADAILREQEP